MKILAIDTSCDETSIAIVEDDRVIANKLSSQISSHKEWGGVVPSLARRKHEELFPLVLEKALKQAKTDLSAIDVVAVTRGPGLAIALEVGIREAVNIARTYNKPLVAVNHMEGHIYSTLAKNAVGKPEIVYEFPLLALLISGGHTELVLMRGHGEYEIIGETQDDSIGEAYDKVGRMLDMGYPAGPVLEKIAEDGNEDSYILPIPMRYSGDAHMSYSGLKTASMQLITETLNNPTNKYQEKFKTSLQKSFKDRKLKKEKKQQTVNIEKQLVSDIAASFQKAAVLQVLLKTEYAIKKLSEKIEIKDLIIGGGVAQNKYLRKMFRKKFGKSLRIHYPNDKKLFTDNAGMIGVAAYFNALRNKYVLDLDSIDRDPNWRIDEINPAGYLQDT